MKLAFKTTTYALTHMVIAFVVAWVVSGSLAVALGISLIEPVFQVCAYFVHEKLWVKYGNKASDHHAEQNVSCIAPCCAPTLIEKIKQIKAFKRVA